MSMCDILVDLSFEWMLGPINICYQTKKLLQSSNRVKK